MTSTLPFSTPSVNTHAGFVMTRLTNNPGEASQARCAKPPGKPLVPYMRYSKKMWPKVRAENSDSQMWDIGKIIGAMWRDLPEKEKAVYQTEYEHDKVDYDKQMKQYRTTNSYHQVIANKAAGTVRQEAPRALPDSGVYIQGVDEDDGESQLSIRKVAASRFERNQRLIFDLFNEQCVHDTRTVTTQSRMTMLKRQSASLALHQSKLEAELDSLDQKFQAKKRLIEDCGQAFSVKLTKVCEDKSHLDKEKYEEMIDTATDRLTESYKTYKEQMEEIERLQQEHKRLVQLSPEELAAELENKKGKEGAGENKLESTEKDEAPPKEAKEETLTPSSPLKLNGHTDQNEDITSEEGDADNED